MHSLGPEFNHTPERSLAQEAISFALTDELAATGDTSGSSVTLLQETIKELQTDFQDTGIVWTRWNHDVRLQQLGHNIFGYVEKEYPDGSKLHVSIQEPMGPTKPRDPLWRDDALTISLRTAHPSDQSKAARVGYRVERGGAAILCDVDKAFGANILGAMALLDKLDEAGPLEDADLEEILGGILLESSIMAEGLSPELDADIEELRDRSEAYKLVSDSARDEMSGRQLEEQLGLNIERALSLQETETLADFLRTL